MATFLTTAKMNPALAARVAASVGGRDAQARVSKRLVALARLLFVVTVVGVLWGLVTSRRRAERELVSARQSFAATVRAEGADLTPENRALVARFEAWVVRLAGAYEGDLVDPSVRGPGALGRVLARPSVYLRGPLDALGGVPEHRRASAMTSPKDALVVCLVDPPTLPAGKPAEPALLDRTRAAYTSALETKTPTVRRLGDAIAGLPLLEGAWADAAERAPDPNELSRLRGEWTRAPIARAKEAARAELFLIAIDEPGDGSGPTELDGERPHAVRLALVDAKANRVLFRLRRRVDPSWITPSRRPTYAAGLDSCKLALDVRDAAQ